ncbi:unnamed protein product [Linum tenue]|uniref:Uncharacterized protein n=1 Tax=Linum tenue TaxID=586396 RepID=A0AAV0JCG2_9ROSI|nr:unnamed protein product [Linum tenue]
MPCGAWVQNIVSLQLQFVLKNPLSRSLIFMIVLLNSKLTSAPISPCPLWILPWLRLISLIVAAHVLQASVRVISLVRSALLVQVVVFFLHHLLGLLFLLLVVPDSQLSANTVTRPGIRQKPASSSILVHLKSTLLLLRDLLVPRPLLKFHGLLTQLPLIT